MEPTVPVGVDGRVTRVGAPYDEEVGVEVLEDSLPEGVGGSVSRPSSRGSKVGVSEDKDCCRSQELRAQIP